MEKGKKENNSNNRKYQENWEELKHTSKICKQYDYDCSRCPVAQKYAENKMR